MPPQPWRWNWGSLFVYCVACFLIGLASGMMRIPGVFPVGLGVVAGLCAARWQWFQA
jgi:hypothetical protein